MCCIFNEGFVLEITVCALTIQCDINSDVVMTCAFSGCTFLSQRDIRLDMGKGDGNLI